MVLLILCFSIASLTGCQNGHEDQAATTTTSHLEPLQVSTATVSSVQAKSLTEVMGTVQAVERATIGARVNGHIVKLPVLLGSKVKKGDLLVTISAGEISAQLLQAQAQLSKAQRNLDREKKLLAKKAATPETVKSLEDLKRIAEASFKEAQTMLGFTQIQAPFDGTITAKTANIGDLASAGKPLLTLENEAALQVIADVPEALILKVKIGDKLPVSIPAANLQLSGTVSEIAPAADPRSHTAPVKLSIESNPNVRPGQFARVALPGDSSTTIMIPESSLSTFGQMERVFVVNDAKAWLRLVRSGARHGDQVEILTGLVTGETIVTSSTTALRDGQPVLLQ